MPAMCGVAGIFNYGDVHAPVNVPLLKRMTRLLAHRGPDDEAFHVAGPLGLGHRRLSILDVSANGAQPMSTPDGNAWLSYNGEFYNHKSFRSQLEGHGYTFRGNSDTETLLYLLHHGGPQALAQAAGIFALAYWDAKEHRLILARDPLGVKQLYFHDDGERLLFASEIKALLTCPTVTRQMDQEAVNQYLHFHAPLFGRTFFAGIQQIGAAEYLEITPSGRRTRQYWQLSGFAPRPGGPEENAAALRQILTEVVHDQLASDVPVGAFFSGGIDSCAIAAFAKRNGTALRCFGVHFEHPEVIDERPYQEAAAQALGLPLELMTVGPGSLPSDLQRLMYFQDQPVIGAAMLPMYHVSKLAAQQVKVCLGGQAADEIFGGYARYALAHPTRALFSMPRRRSPGAGPPALPMQGNLLKQLASLRNVRRLARSALSTRAADRYFDTFALVHESQWRALSVGPSLISRQRARQVFDDALAACPAPDISDKLMHWDVQTYLSGLFQQDDRMSMANSLESRVPFADPRLVRFAFHTPFSLKLRQGSTKWLLRQAVADSVPPQVLSRRKVGFDTPVAAWLRGPHQGFVRDVLLSKTARERGLWQPERVAQLLAQPQRTHWFDMVWKLLCIELWSNIFLDGPRPAP